MAGATKASAIVHGGYRTTPEGATVLWGARRLSLTKNSFGFKESGSLVVTADDDPAPLKL